MENATGKPLKDYRPIEQRMWHFMEEEIGKKIMSEHLTKELSENLSCDVLSKYIKSDLDYYWIYGNRYIYLSWCFQEISFQWNQKTVSGLIIFFVKEYNHVINLFSYFMPYCRSRTDCFRIFHMGMDCGHKKP